MRTIPLVSLPQHDANLKKQLRETGRKSVLHTDVWRERNEKECWWKKVNKRARGSKRLERDKKMRILIEPDKMKWFEREYSLQEYSLFSKFEHSCIFANNSYYTRRNAQYKEFDFELAFTNICRVYQILWHTNVPRLL